LSAIQEFGPTSNLRFLVTGVAFLVGVFATSAQIAAPAGAVSYLAVHAISGELTPVPVGDKLIGPALPSRTMSLEVTLQPRDPSALAAEVKAVSDPTSPQYRHFITPAEFAHSYGPTAATIARVTTALEGEGLTVGPISGTGLYLPVRGTVARMESAFVTPLLSYKLPTGKVGLYNSAEPSVPSSVAPDIEGVIGLNTLDVARPVGPVTPRGSQAKATAHASPSLAPNQPTPGASCSSSFTTLESSDGALSADELAQAYSFGGLYTNQDYGAGSTIALVELDGAGYSPSDISTFATCYGITLGGSQVSEVLSDGNTGATGDGTVEAELDIETALSLAPDANIKVYESDNVYDAFSNIVSDDAAKIVSDSWASCEQQIGSTLQQEENTLLDEASLDGQTVFSAAGDSGAQGCNANVAFGVATGAQNEVEAQALNASNGTLYVANAGADTVSVINEGDNQDTGAVVGTITTQSLPYAVVYDAANSELYIANRTSNSVTVVSTTSCNSSVVTGCSSTTNYLSPDLIEPQAMALDGSTLYVSNAGAASVAVFDTANNTFLGDQLLPSGSSAGPILVNSDHEVYVANDMASIAVDYGIDYFNSSSCNVTSQSGCGTVASAISGFPVAAMTLDPTNADIYVATWSTQVAGEIDVVSTSSNTLLTTISTSSSPTFVRGGPVSSVGMSPSGSQVLAIVDTGGYGDQLATINPATQTVSGAVGFNTGGDAMGQMVSDPTTNLMWVTDQSAGDDIVDNFNLAVNDPAAQPDVTGVGGTTVTNVGPAPTEKVWNDNNMFGQGAGGGGISMEFDMPSYQQALGEVSGSSGTPCANAGGDCRDVPDVSADADPNTGYIIYDSVDGVDWTTAGGTSATSPLWAAALADISSADGASAIGYGSLNPTLYSLAQASPGAYFNDVTNGNNDYNSSSGGQFPAMAGYDMATGLGTPIVSTLAAGMVLAVPGAPSLTTATPGNGQVLLDWTAPQNTGGSAVTNYEILRGTSTGGESATPIATVGNVLTYTDASATNGTKFYYEVEAVNAVGHSVVSNELSATPALTVFTVTFNNNGGTGTMASEIEGGPTALPGNTSRGLATPSPVGTQPPVAPAPRTPMAPPIPSPPRSRSTLNGRSRSRSPSTPKAVARSLR
jgi:YVTN family beta-propeller protein